MKTITLLVMLGLVSVAGAKTARNEKPVTNVDVIFVEPEKFSDVKDGYMDSERGRNALLDQLKDHLVDQAGRLVGLNQRLEIKVTDVDLAGDFEPWRGMDFQDV